MCGCGDLYKQKDFPHRLGMFVLMGSFAASVYTYLVYDKWLTWAILIGSAAFDGLLYLWVGDALVCYRCGAHHRGFPKGSPKTPFELTVGERYRQERIRRERLKTQTTPEVRDRVPLIRFMTKWVKCGMTQSHREHRALRRGMELPR